jgi:copper homeostasis protein
MILEACVETIEGAKMAEHHGAHRLELCSDLHLDGLSPSIELITEVLKVTTIPVKVMVRLKAGSFIYSDEDLKEMIDYCESCIEYPIQGFVTGLNTPDKKIDVKRLKMLTAKFPNHSFTFHKAIDLVPNPIEEMIRCIDIPNLTHILTSGKEPTAVKGISTLKKMVNQLQPRFKIIAAGKITQENIDYIKKESGASEFHGKQIV